MCIEDDNSILKIITKTETMWALFRWVNAHNIAKRNMRYRVHVWAWQQYANGDIFVEAD